jgi:hypothetical protein
MFKRSGLSLLLLVTPLSLGAQQVDFERVLLPVSAPESAGAYGSRWVVEHFVRNDGTTPVQVERDDCGNVSCLVSVPPQTSFQAAPAMTKDRLWFSVEKAKIGQMFFSTVVRDIGKSIEPWGTEIPSVRESEFRDGKVQLLNVPGDPTFRKTLRIYLIPVLVAGADAQVTLAVRIFDLDAELNGTPRLLSEKDYTARNTMFQQRIDYLPIFDLDTDFPTIRTVTRLRVEVERVSGLQATLWALLSVTNNSTQHVTTFTP